MVAYAGSHTRIAHVVMILTQSKVKINGTGLLNLQKLRKIALF